MHVHHIKPISEIGDSYKVNPISDLIPVCPNCHAVIDLKIPPYLPSELIAMLHRTIHTE
ncbi:MAG: HNH endonuclease [Pseudanabaena sp.]